MNAPISLAGDIAVTPGYQGASSRLQLAGILVLVLAARAMFWNVRPPDTAFKTS